ncbi:uncharacterized protein LY89DRAFT_689806 [Mollisia scopiformis]|uniref:Uncharacterized protein n=1 Tax=Mollisia scopiformis TaxID=149040 RepID=A0A132BDI7_MOLSC|nr:uncharacterized protein LY89DRAFT_689806 [Mollisia scopiformis]KUJ09904.1 hypothetical protein LY89DRAFT_689806 [Mollisia scopiformis]
MARVTEAVKASVTMAASYMVEICFFSDLWACYACLVPVSHVALSFTLSSYQSYSDAQVSGWAQ